MSSLLAIFSSSLLIPTSLKATLTNGKEDELINKEIPSLSRRISVILLIVYVSFSISIRKSSKYT